MSSKSQQPVSPGSDDCDEKKRKRKESNRVSARRSRERKQQRVEELVAQETKLKEQIKNQGLTIDTLNQLYLNVASDNNVLRAQMAELSDRLRSLNQIISDSSALAFDVPDVLMMEPWQGISDNLLEPWQLPYPTQSIPSNVDLFKY